MSTTDPTPPSRTSDDAAAAQLPFIAPCRPLATTAPLGWIRKGFADMRAAPKHSLTYGAVVVALSLVVALIALERGNYFVLLALMSGFIFVAPVVAIGTYAISCSLEQGQRPSLRRCLFEERRALGNLAVFALMLLVVFLVWARAGSMVHVFFPIEDHPGWRELLRFYAIGSAVGSIFAAIVFSAAAFSLPMMMERRVDTVTAVVSSVNAVLRNKPAMAVWATLIVLAVAPGFSLLMLGRERGGWVTALLLLLGLTLPLIGHATWHGYRETIDAGAWPINRAE